MRMLVAFEKEFPDADPVMEAEAVFDLEAAGYWHKQDARFSLNACDAYTMDDGRVGVPVEGCRSLTDLQRLCKVKLFRNNLRGASGKWQRLNQP